MVRWLTDKVSDTSPSESQTFCVSEVAKIMVWNWVWVRYLVSPYSHPTHQRCQFLVSANWSMINETKYINQWFTRICDFHPIAKYFYHRRRTSSTDIPDLAIFFSKQLKVLLFHIFLSLSGWSESGFLYVPTRIQSLFPNDTHLVMLKRNYESIPKISPIFWIIFQKYRHFLWIGGFSWEWEQGVSDSTFISPQMYKRCRFWRNKTLKVLLTYEPLLLLYYTESYAPKTGSFEKSKQHISDSMYDDI